MRADGGSRRLRGRSTERGAGRESRRAAAAQRSQHELVQERAVARSRAPRRRAAPGARRAARRRARRRRGPAKARRRAAVAMRAQPRRAPGGEARAGGEGGGGHRPAALRLDFEQRAGACPRPQATSEALAIDGEHGARRARRPRRRLDARAQDLQLARPRRVVTVPGQGWKPRTRRAIASAGRVQSMPPVLLLEDRRERGPRVVLGRGRERAPREPVERLQQDLRPQAGQPRLELRRRLLGTDRRRRGRAGSGPVSSPSSISIVVTPVSRLAVHDRPVDGRRAAVARQQRASARSPCRGAGCR